MMLYDELKNKLFIKVRNIDANEQSLTDVPYKVIEDLVITYHIKGDDGSESIVSNGDMKSYGITLEQLHNDATVSGAKLMPARVMNLDHMMEEVFHKSTNDSDTGLIVVSTEVLKDGAAALFYPDMMKFLAYALGDGYYVVPSSVHEVLIASDNDYDARRLMMVHKSVMPMVSEKDYLSDKIYRYDAQKKALTIACENSLDGFLA